MTISGATLGQMREIQKVTAPDMCLGASKFLLLKVLGFIAPHRHLSDFLSSTWAKQNEALPLVNCWGWKLNLYNDDFNAKVLPAALNDDTAGVRSGTRGKVDIRYDYFQGDAARADNLLRGGVPLVVGVGLGGPGRDHHIAVVPASDGIWAVDPWPGPVSKAVQRLPAEFTFTKVHVIDLSSGSAHIPCGTPMVGYYRDADYESRHAFTVNEGATAGSRR